MVSFSTYPHCPSPLACPPLASRWVKAMVSQGSGGAYEVSQRMTALIGWGATVSFTDGWVWDQAAETYVMDPEVADQLRKNNPQVRGGYPEWGGGARQQQFEFDVVQVHYILTTSL